MKLGSSPFLKLLVLAVVMSPLVSKADLMTTLGNNPQPNEQNVLFNTTQNGNTVNGVTNISNTMVSFASSTDTLGANANGQAVLTSGNPNDPLLNQVSISIPGGTFNDIILNPQIPGPNSGISGPFDLTITLNTTTGVYTYSFPLSGKNTLGNGNNFVTFFATDGTMINSVDLTSTSGIDNLTQVRLSGVVTSTPEPASLLLLGFGLTAVPFLRRRRV